jgi:hypothetical protein
MVEADEKASFLTLPNFLKYNRPESPNVLKAWAGAFDLLPECHLKSLLWNRLKDFAEALTKAFREAFAEAFGKALPIPEPEPEQEQEQEPPPQPPPVIENRTVKERLAMLPEEGVGVVVLEIKNRMAGGGVKHPVTMALSIIDRHIREHRAKTTAEEARSERRAAKAKLPDSKNRKAVEAYLGCTVGDATEEEIQWMLDQHKDRQGVRDEWAKEQAEKEAEKEPENEKEKEEINDAIPF